MDAPLTPPKRADHPDEAPIKVPGSLAVRWDIIALAQSNERRGLAAALGVCWSGPGRPRTPYKPADPAAYAGAIIDELLERPGVSMVDIMRAGARAYVEIATSMPSEQEVESAAGNSGAAETAQGSR